MQPSHIFHASCMCSSLETQASVHVFQRGLVVVGDCNILDNWLHPWHWIRTFCWDVHHLEPSKHKHWTEEIFQQVVESERQTTRYLLFPRTHTYTHARIDIHVHTYTHNVKCTCTHIHDTHLHIHANTMFSKELGPHTYRYAMQWRPIL